MKSYKRRKDGCIYRCERFIDLPQVQSYLELIRHDEDIVTCEMRLDTLRDEANTPYWIVHLVTKIRSIESGSEENLQNLKDHYRT